MTRTVPIKRVKKKGNDNRKYIAIFALLLIVFTIIPRLKSYSFEGKTFDIDIPTGYGTIVNDTSSDQEFIGYKEVSSSNTIVVLSNKYKYKKADKIYKQILNGAMQKNITTPVFQDFNSRDTKIDSASETTINGKKAIEIIQKGKGDFIQKTYVFATNKYIVIVSGSSSEVSQNIVYNGVYDDVVKTLNIHDTDFNYMLVVEVILGAVALYAIARGVIALNAKMEKEEAKNRKYNYTPSYKINYDYKPEEKKEGEDSNNSNT